MIELNGHTLSMNDARRVLFQKELVSVHEDAWENVKKSRLAVQNIVELDQVVYGVTTGFGKLSDVSIPSKQVEKLQLYLIRSHACGVGEPFPEIVSRAMLLLRANTLIKGYSGVRAELIECLLQCLNASIHPVIPQQGSLGASGDLAPLAHLALMLVGEGKVYTSKGIRPAEEALKEAGITPLILQAKEGLALINGTQAMTAMGLVVYLEAEKLMRQLDGIACMTLEGLRAITDAFDEDIHIARGYVEQIETAERIRTILIDSKLTTRQGELRVQDAYSLRCIPQVHGATKQVMSYVKEKLLVEMNAATDNPLIFSDAHKVLSGGNFHGQPIAFAMDFLGIGLSELANISERRIERLVNPQLNDLPPFLSPSPGLQSGAMIMQYVAAALVSENKVLAHPASVDSIPSSANQEDHVSMGTIGARKAHAILINVRRVAAIEAICAMQAVEYRGIHKMSSVTRDFYEKMRKVVPSIQEDRPFSEDIERLNDWLIDDEPLWK
ncbi:histidine ammonia-lyase [Priestia koreensis]|uniref:Histidine ammonia-lyase n=1 Tax=Priestia koreensis TaxID=284581 RepID=A0A0M0KVT1_9BACI|nr:histidine ammonia-lyase [Priestia koreensis]KOO42935.1 histidine ammonia-lyase [Priestia koreensis]